MNIWMGALACVLVLSGSHVEAQAQSGKQSSAFTKSIRVIRDNAELIEHNAGIYQWVRVNREVDRIVPAAKDIQKLLTAEPNMKEKTDTLMRLVGELRAARVVRNVEVLQDTAHRLAEHLNSF